MTLSLVLPDYLRPGPSGAASVAIGRRRGPGPPVRCMTASPTRHGQSTVTVDGDRATGETYCLAHHLWTEEGRRTLMVMSIRYHDTFVRQGGRWFFAERRLITDWVDRRPSTA